MKKRFFIGIIVLIILLSVTRVFAVTSNNIEPRDNTSRNSTENTVNSNSTNELSEEDLIPALEEELREKQEQAREEAAEEEEENKNSENTTNRENSVDKEVSNTTKNNSSNTKKDYDKEILSDIYITELNQDTVYENTYIDGNIYIVSSSKVEFKDCEIIGNIFIISNVFELNNTKIEGSCFTVSNNVNLIESQVTSMYSVANTIESDEDSEIANDIRAVANTVNFLGEVGRDSYIQVFDTSNIEYSVTIQDILPELLTKYAIILVITIFVLCGFPKFVGVNLPLRISSFFKAFFTGIIEIIIIALISLTLMILGLGAGYGFAILILLSALVCFGKAIFIIAFALRLVRNKGKNARVKAFIYTIFVSAVVIALDLLVILGETGFLATLIINIILAITGFGTLLRVIFTSKVKKQEVPKVQEVASAPIEPETPKNVSKPIIKEAELIPNEVKKDAPIEHNLRLEIENVTEDGKRPEVYEITGKIIKRRIYPEEDIEKSEEVNLTENLTDEQEKTKKQIQDEEEKTEE